MHRVELTVILLLLVPDPLKRFYKSEVFAAHTSQTCRVSVLEVDSCVGKHFDAPDHLYDPAMA